MTPTQPTPEERLRELEAACLAKDAFIGAISRELNNPLSPVLLSVERLRRLLQSDDPVRLEAAVSMVERSTQAFAKRTRLLLDLADLAAGAVGLDLSPVDLSALVGAAARRHADMARVAGCQVMLEAAPGLLVLGNEAALVQVLDHLLGNAFRFGAGRPVELAVRRGTGADVVMSVTDHGPGVSAELAGRMFGLLQQDRDSLQPGLGIGLWVCAQRIAAMGGTIGVRSEPGEGAHFHVSLPSAQGGSVAPSLQNLQTGSGPGGL